LCDVDLTLAIMAAMPVATALGVLSDAKFEALSDGCQVRYMAIKLIELES
jgi:hypothetical protein